MVHALHWVQNSYMKNTILLHGNLKMTLCHGHPNRKPSNRSWGVWELYSLQQNFIQIVKSTFGAQLLAQLAR